MVYDAPYLTWKLSGISMSFAVDEETFASLSGYFR